MKDQSNFDEFMQQLVDHYPFPTLYLVKFIVRAEKSEVFKILFSVVHFDP